MSQAALTMTPVTASKWTVVAGPMKGSVRLMSAPQFTVGRSPECEFVIVNDPKCSRKHGQVQVSGVGVEVFSLNDKNLVQVNGREVERCVLNDGDVVTFGDTEVQFHTTTTTKDSPGLALVTSPGTPRSSLPDLPLPPPRQMGAPHRPQNHHRAAAPPAKSKRTFYIILAVVGVLLYLVLSPSSLSKKAAQIRTEQDIQNDIESTKKLREASEMQNSKHLDQTVTARQAQENFVRGFRDYKNGQFERALTSFQACLALNPDHTLCNRYLRLDQRKFDELVQYQMVWGRKYRDQNQYKACRSSFRNVMVMVKDQNSPVYQEAKANYDACDSLVEGRF